MKSLGRSLVVVAAAFVLAHLHAAAPAVPSISAAGQNELSHYLTAAVDRGDVPGVVALVLNREGVLYEGTAGKVDVARRADMPANAIFRIASMTRSRNICPTSRTVRLSRRSM